MLQSAEGTTQGDPLAMQMYAIATIPLIKKLQNSLKEISQIWYADDACASGKIDMLHAWWKMLSIEGPKFGYYPNPAKTWLVTKPSLLQAATTTFANTDIKITSDGRPYLGTAIGTTEYVTSFVKDKVSEWSKELKLLTTIALSHPHAAYSAFNHGFSHKWSFLMRTTPGISHLFHPLEDIIRTQFIPSLTGQLPPNDQVRSLLALPARLGGIALTNPVLIADHEYSDSCEITGPLSSALALQNTDSSIDLISEVLQIKSTIHKRKRDRSTAAADLLRTSLSTSQLRSIELASEQGSSAWLTSIPIKEFGFSLHKRAFQDALALRYNWQPSLLPSYCTCGKTFSIEHALSCPKGGFPSIRHNEIRDLTAKLLTEVCSDVRVEPDLQPVQAECLPSSTNNNDGARLDIAANGFWGGRYERTFFDVRIFNPFAPSNSSSLPNCYRRHENLKKNQYEARVREVEHSSFTPLVLSATGGMARESSIFYKRLASCLALKWDQSYNSTISWLRSRITFSLIRSAIQCLRGARSSLGHPEVPQAIDLALSELRISS